MIDAIAADGRLSDAYDELLEQDAFRTELERFAQLWPVLNVRDIRRKLGPDALWQPRGKLVAACREQRVRMSPERPEEGPPTWPDLIRTIYVVRCNLFHVAKSPNSARDMELIGRSAVILRTFIEKSACFNWGD
jgi:hypothetical protein